MSETRPDVAAVARADGWDKVTGRARFVDDIHVEGAWFAGSVRASVPRARVRGIHFDPSFDWDRVVRVTAGDLPFENVVKIIGEDLPVLAHAEVSHAAEPLCLIAAPDAATLAAALAAVKLDLEPLPAVEDIDAALSCSTVIRAPDNVLSTCSVGCGDAAGVLARAARIVTGTYRTGLQEHAYLEPSGVIAIPTDGGIDIVGSLQCPYYVVSALERVLGSGKIRVRQSEIGGAFGGKEDYPSVMAVRAAALALRARRPVRLIYERHEDMIATTKRHPSLVRHRTAVSDDGTLLAMQVDLVLDGGAYLTLSPVVLQRSVLHATGAYRCPDVDVQGRVVATNTPPNGAFRGFGAPQAVFAVERHMDRIACELGISPLAIRLKNMLVPGDRMPCGQLLDESAAARQVLERAITQSDYGRKHERYGNAHEEESTRRGIGISLFLHGAGFTGGGEERISGVAAMRLAAGGLAEVLVSSTEMGQGARTVLPMIAAEALGWPPDLVSMPLADTSVVPDTGPTVASRTTMVVGSIVERAAGKLDAEIRAHVAARHGLDPEGVSTGDGGYVDPSGNLLDTFRAAAQALLDERGEVRVEARYRPPAGHRFDDDTMTGDAYLDYAWGADVVEVEVDTQTFEVRPLTLTIAHDIGRAIHPVLAAGQMEGGSLQGLGFASIEEMRLAGCHYQQDRMSTYIVPTAADAPDYTTSIVEVPGSFGPGGAKGLGELPLGGVPPAYAAAVQNACGLSSDEVPVTPEKLLALYREGGS